MGGELVVISHCRLSDWKRQQRGIKEKIVTQIIFILNSPKSSKINYVEDATSFLRKGWERTQSFPIVKTCRWQRDHGHGHNNKILFKFPMFSCQDNIPI